MVTNHSILCNIVHFGFIGFICTNDHYIIAINCSSFICMYFFALFCFTLANSIDYLILGIFFSAHCTHHILIFIRALKVEFTTFNPRNQCRAMPLFLLFISNNEFKAIKFKQNAAIFSKCVHRDSLVSWHSIRRLLNKKKNDQQLGEKITVIIRSFEHIPIANKCQLYIYSLDPVSRDLKQNASLSPKQSCLTYSQRFMHVAY